MQRLLDQVSRGWRGAGIGDHFGERESRDLPAPAAAARGPVLAPAAAEVIELDLVGHLHRPSHIHKLTLWLSVDLATV